MFEKIVVTCVADSAATNCAPLICPIAAACTAPIMPPPTMPKPIGFFIVSPLSEI
jgi:hypothetical protein